MSSLETRLPDINGPRTRAAAWIDVKTAAERMNVSERWIVGRCSSKWASGSMAKLESPPGGGKPRWMIREDADERLAKIKFPEQLPADTSGLTDSQRTALDRRIAIYQGWEAACREAVRGGVTIEAATVKYLGTIVQGEGETVDAATLYRWRRDFRREGVTGLIDGRWKRPDKTQADDPFLEEVARLWLLPQRMSVKLCWDLACEAAKRKGWRSWSHRTAERHVRSINPCVRIYRRQGKKAFTDQGESYIERDYSTLVTNELWNADHHQFDVMVEVPGGKTNTATGETKRRFIRPWLSVWQDCRSRKIVGWHITDGAPDTDCILSALRTAVMTHGVPQACHVDNGKDFDSYALHGRTKKERRRRSSAEIEIQRINGVFTQLGIDAHNVQAYHGQSKPIERFFGTLEGRFGKLWPSYCGNKPENRPEGLQARLDAGKAPTMQEFIAAFSQWVHNDYNAGSHSGDSMEGKSPDEVFLEHFHTKRTTTEERLNLLLQKQSRPVRVTQNGVTWNGLSYGKHEVELYPYLGQLVTLRVDPNDVSRVTVWEIDGKFICAASSNYRLPPRADSSLLSQAMAEKRRDRKARLEYQEARLRLQDNLPDRIVRAAEQRNADRAAANPPAPVPPPSISPIRSPFEDQLPEVQRALEQPILRKAVGAEEFNILDAYTTGPYLSSSDNQGGSESPTPSLSLVSMLRDESPSDFSKGA